MRLGRRDCQRREQERKVSASTRKATTNRKFSPMSTRLPMIAPSSSTPASSEIENAMEGVRGGAVEEVDDE